ncbi:hypothetical protein LINPERHAP2_LOCUS10862 [Linum perenne]
MSKPNLRPPKSGRTNLASCIVATIFLLFIVIILLIVFFTVFKPKDLKISVTAIHLPSFFPSNNAVNFTFSQSASVQNPNRGPFHHYDSTLQLVYSGSQVGFMFIPAGQIGAGQTKYMDASFAVTSFPLSPAAAANPESASAAIGRVGPTMEIESRIRFVGRIRVLNLFAHHVEARSRCRAAVSVSDGSVMGFHC